MDPRVLEMAAGLGASFQYGAQRMVQHPSLQVMAHDANVTLTCDVMPTVTSANPGQGKPASFFTLEKGSRVNSVPNPDGSPRTPISFGGQNWLIIGFPVGTKSAGFGWVPATCMQWDFSGVTLAPPPHVALPQQPIPQGRARSSMRMRSLRGGIGAEEAAGLAAMFQSSAAMRPMGPPSVCSHWIMADHDLNTFLLNNPHSPVVQALDAQLFEHPYNTSWQQAFVPSEGNRWWGRKKVGQQWHPGNWQYYNCETTMPQNGEVNAPVIPRPPSVPQPQPPIARSAAASRRYRFP